MITLTPLQEELFVQLVDTLEDIPDELYEKEEEALQRDIQSLNAAELRHNIKVFTEADA